MDFKLYTHILFLFVTNIIVGQDSFVTTGNSIENSFGSVYYSIGQFTYSYTENDLGLMFQGVQQNFEVLALNVDILSPFKIKIYPNPVSDFLIVDIENSKTDESISIYLYDVNGKEVFSSDMKINSNIIEIKSLKRGAYFLKLFSNTTIIGSYKIIKN